MKPFRLLLVEDDSDSAEAISELLRMQGVHVEWAATAGEAITLFEAGSAHAVDVILLDLMLPDMDGATLISRLGRIASLPPIVIHSAATEPLLREAARKLGAAAVLRKPTDWRAMKETLMHVTDAAVAPGR